MHEWCNTNLNLNWENRKEFKLRPARLDGKGTWTKQALLGSGKDVTFQVIVFIFIINNIMAPNVKVSLGYVKKSVLTKNSTVEVIYYQL